MIHTYGQLELLQTNSEMFVLGIKQTLLLIFMVEIIKMLQTTLILLLIMIQLLRCIWEISVFLILGIMMVLINHLQLILINIKVNLEPQLIIFLEINKYIQLLEVIYQEVMLLMLLFA